MAVFERRSFGLAYSFGLVSLVASGLILSTGCASGPGAEPSTPPTAAPTVQPSPPPADPPPPLPEEPPKPASRREAPSNDVVVIDPGGRPKDRDNYLADIAQAERNRRSMTDAPVIVVTDANLAQHAEGGKLTFSNDPVVTEDRTDELYDSAANMDAQEAYWRTRVRTKRQEWAEKVEEIFELEQRASDLRVQFYAADDPFYRDTRIKPEWDRTLDNIVEARRTAYRLEQEVTNAVAEGGRAGAFPGWLNDGTHLEPKERPYTADGSAPVQPDSVEPTMVEETP